MHRRVASGGTPALRTERCSHVAVFCDLPKGRAMSAQGHSEPAAANGRPAMLPADERRISHLRRERLADCERVLEALVELHLRSVEGPEHGPVSREALSCRPRTTSPESQSHD